MLLYEINGLALRDYGASLRSVRSARRAVLMATALFTAASPLAAIFIPKMYICAHDTKCPS